MDKDKLDELEKLKNKSVVSFDDSIDIESLKEKAKNDDLNALFTLGECYYNSINVPYDYNQAFRYFMKATDLGHADAACYLGRCYMLGQGVFADEAKAFYYFDQSASLKSIIGCAFLGTAYLTGNGVKANYQKARKLLQYAAEGDNIGAQFLLAVIYFDGIGVLPIYDKTVYWCRRAIQNGSDEALELLAICYFEEISSVKTDWVIFSLFYYLANKGNVRSMYYLGLCFEKGISVKKDMNKAKSWYLMASNNGFTLAKDRMKKNKFTFFKAKNIELHSDLDEFNKDLIDKFEKVRFKNPPYAQYNDNAFYNEKRDPIYKIIHDNLRIYGQVVLKERFDEIFFSQDDNFDLKYEERFLYMLITKKLIEEYPIVSKIVNDELKPPKEMMRIDNHINEKLSQLISERNKGLHPIIAESYIENFREPLYTITNTGKIKDYYNKLNKRYDQYLANVNLARSFEDKNFYFIKDYLVKDFNDPLYIVDFIVVCSKGVFTINVRKDPFHENKMGASFRLMSDLKATDIDGYTRAKLSANAIEAYINEKLNRKNDEFNYVMTRALVGKLDENTVSNHHKRRVMHYSKLASYLQKLDDILSDEDQKIIIETIEEKGKSVDVIPMENYRKYVIDLSLSLSNYYNTLMETAMDSINFMCNMDGSQW